jgi:hypothetical protein
VGGAAAAGSAVATTTVGVLTALAFAAGTTLGAVGHAWLAPAPPASVHVVREVVTVERVVSAPSTTNAPALAEEPAPSAQRSVLPRDTKPTTAVSSAPVSAAARDRALREETALIARAQAALLRGDVAQGELALREHARRFPQGQLVDERFALEARLRQLRGTAPGGDTP